ncbi:MAG: T9SS type A sorting domain-containing protein, partial [Bacteroidota bacterium]
LPAFNGRLIPYFPNYRLGALGPGGCDSLLTGVREVPPEAQEPLFSVYPNPGNGQIQLQFAEPPLVGDIIVVTNSYGQEVLRQTAAFPSIDMTALPSGLYYVAYRRAGDLLTMIKWIKS